MREPDDHELLGEFARNGSEPAFAALVTRYVNLVHSAAFRFTGDSHHAEEITQAVFIILARQAGKVSSRVVLSGWLYQVARLTAANFVKGEVRRQRREQEAGMQSILNEPDTAAWQQIAPWLDEAMGSLGKTDRDAVVLRYFENKSAAEIGAALRMNEEAARRRVNRAVEKLRKFFSRRGVVSTGAIIAGAISANSVQAAPAALAKSVTAVAISKGAVASASTLTLIKGVLKLMAWAKTKIMLGTTVAIVLASVGVLTTVNYYHPALFSRNERLKLPTGSITPMIGYGYSRYEILLASDGSLWSWGEERLGWPVLGLKAANIQNSTSLRRIGKDTDWTSVGVGDSHCLAIKADGSLWAWGGNFRYQLGEGTKVTRSTPVRSIPGNNWRQAAAGGSASYALKNDGTLWAWGAGYLGTGDHEESANAIQVGSSKNWKKIWAGGIQTVGLQSDGTLWFWGSLDGDSEEKNIFHIPTQISPDTNWTDACFGYFTVLTIKSDGTLWSWGLQANFYTQAADDSSNGVPMRVGTENDWDSCSSSSGNFFHILRKKDGSLWALDASEHRTIKPATSYQPVKLQKIEWDKAIAAFAAGGDDIGVILTKDGEVWTWGRVIGEFSPKDYRYTNGQRIDPKPKIMNKPWRLSNIATPD